MSISGVGYGAGQVIQTLIDLRTQLNDLQTQFGTGRKSDTYAGLGIERGLAVSLRFQQSALDSYSQIMTLVATRLSIAQTTLTGLDQMRQDVRGALLSSPFSLDANGQTLDQKRARDQLDQILSALNGQAGDRYLFSGRSTDQPAVESRDRILNGDGARAGLRQITDERRQADLGSNGLGRLVIPAAAGSVVSIAEDVAGSPFGFKLAGVNSALTGATVSGPAGAPAGISIDLGASNPADGDTIAFTFALPDGSTETLTLTATASAAPGAGAFSIGATAADTAANLQAALAGAVSKLAATSLVAASATAAADDFFNVDAANPPRRVAGPPFETATALVAGTAADTVTWYLGEAGSDSARSTAVARIDPTLSVSYGLRANERAIRSLVAGVAVLAVMTFPASDTNGADRYQALTQRVGAALAEQPGTQKLADITVDLASAQTAMEATRSRQDIMRNTLTDLLQSIEGISQEEVGAKILVLQNQLQASLQLTAMLYNLSLVQYL